MRANDDMGDIFREIPIRFLGHGFAIGEALRYVYTEETVDTCQKIALGYIILHALSRGYEGGGCTSCTSGTRSKTALNFFFDTLLFDGLASALFPTFVTYHMCKLTSIILADANQSNPLVIWGPTLAGLSLLAFTWEPIDRFSSHILNETIRKLY